MADNEYDINLNQEDVYAVDLNNEPNNYSIEINPTDTFEIQLNEQGPQGDRGQAGNGILSYELTSVSADGLIQTWTITFTNGSTQTINVHNGNGIKEITGPVTEGLVDTYTISYDNGNSTTFNVTNGADGEAADITRVSVTVDDNIGIPSGTAVLGGTPLERTIAFYFSCLKGSTGNGISSIAKTDTSGLIDTYTVTYTDGDSDTFTVTNGEKGDTGNTGATGADGFSPIANVSKSGSVTTITITDKNGTTSEQVLDGVTDVKVDNASVVTAGVANIDLSGYAKTSSLSTVATSGNYNDLSNKPTIPAAQVQSDWNQSDNTAVDYIKNKPYIPSGIVVDQTYDGTSANAQSGVAIAGAGFITSSDIPTEVFIATYNTTPFNDIKTAYDSGKTVLCKHSNMLVYHLFYLYSNKAVFSILSDLSNSNGIVCGILQCSLSGGVTTWTEFTNRLAKYSDIPSVPTVNNKTITIQKNGSTVDSFTLNQSSNKSINITVPTDTNDLTNGAGFITGITSNDVTTALGYTPYNSTNPNGYITSSALSGYATTSDLASKQNKVTITYED